MIILRFKISIVGKVNNKEVGYYLVLSSNFLTYLSYIFFFW